METLFNTENYWDEPELFEDDWALFKQRLLDTAKYSPVIFQGLQELWDGKHKAGYIGDIETGIQQVLSIADDFRFEERDGDLYFVGLHHDGCNEYRVRRITPEGEDILEAWKDPDTEYYSYTEEEIHDLIGDKFSENIGRDIIW